MLETAKKYSIGLWAIRGTADRFVPEGYEEENKSVKKSLEIAGDISGIDGVDFVSDVFDEMNVDQLKRNLRTNDLEPAGINLHSWKKQWSLGSLTNTNNKKREEAINYGKEILDKAEQLGCEEVTLWLGTDGFDYPFQLDYDQHWNLLMDGIRELAQYRSSIDVGIEYKLKEPRKHQTIGTALKALYVVEKIDLDNLGVVVDFGHALMSKENPAETISLISNEDKLTGVHFNDAYREWDDDMVPGSINLWDSLEFLYYLDKVSYDGWISFDIFPFRMTNRAAVETSVKNTDKMIEILSRIDLDDIEKAQQEMNTTVIQNTLFEIL